jgi:hypothetical protein
MAPTRRDARGEGRVLALAECFTAVLYNGLGRYREALTASQRACEFDDLGLHGWALIELIEAAARTHDREVATDALRQLEERTRASGTDWALGIQARSEALVNDDADVDACYLEAIERLARTRIAVHLARAQLIYGEWLRRSDRRVAARPQLRALSDAFETFGAGAFAARARRELLATGETLRPHTPAAGDQLTAGSADRPAGARRADELRDRGPAVSKSPHSRVPLGQSVRQAQDQLPGRPPRRATRPTANCGAGVATRTVRGTTSDVTREFPGR